MFGFGGTTLQGCPGDSAGTLQTQPILIANIDVKLGGSQFANFATPRCEIRNNDAPRSTWGGPCCTLLPPPKKQIWKVAKTLWFEHCAGTTPPGAPGGSLLRRLPPPSPRRKPHLQSAANFCRVVAPNWTTTKTESGPPQLQSRNRVSGAPHKVVCREGCRVVAPKGADQT